MAEHYVGHVKIEKVDREKGVGERGIGDRKVVEVTSITVKSNTLDGLTAKLIGHIGLVEEDEE